MANLRLFTEDEEEYIRYFIYCRDDKNYKEAAKHLGCTTKQIADWRVNHKVENTLYRKWTERECEILRKYHPILNGHELAKMLNRTYSAVNTKCYELGLKKMSYPSQHDEKIRKLGKEGYTVKEIAQELKLPLHAVRSYIYRRDIEYRRESNKNHIWRQENNISMERRKYNC
ncbi:hypothetical protein HCA73_16085 [Listeria booriae]|uniref:hypothetical protein n=1 Tax=Listeria booriae TaxID=1552123 RepID=UPI0016242D2F|nr:hypothetical protein [Listeria booriae]MBC1914172.1 hypothetical protein [Listeria booriae]